MSSDAVQHAGAGTTDAGTDRPGPLVAPAPVLPTDRRDRAQRQILLPGFGDEAQRRLYAARVLVIGAGGLGSASIPYLAGAGVGTIGILDDDAVELSNLHRQIAHRTEDLGRPKAASLADTVGRLDPGVRVIQHQLRLTSRNALEIFAGYDLVIDGSDNFPTRYLANDAAQLTGIPLVWGAILQYHGQVGVAWHAHGPGYRDLFPAPPPPEDVMSCGTGGVLPGLCGTIGSLLATESLKIITGVGDPLIGRVLLYDALAARTRELPYTRDPEARPVTELVDYVAFCAGPDPVPAIDPDKLAAELRGASRTDRADHTDSADHADNAGHTGSAGRGDAGRPGGASTSTATALLLDVRSSEEHASRRIAGSALVPVDELEAGAELPFADANRDPATGDAPVITVYCERDPRSVRAARILESRGLHVRYLRGGVHALAAAAPDLLEGTDV